jgi:hypothetical protein
MHAPLAKFSMVRSKRPSGNWWLTDAAVDLDFRNFRFYDSSLVADPNAASTVLMLHGEGADGSTNFIDSVGHFCIPVTGIGPPVIDTAQFKFGSSSILVDNSYIRINSPDMAFGTGNFTIDCWVRFNSLTSFKGLFANTVGTTTGVIIYLLDTGGSNFVLIAERKNSGVNLSITGTTAIVINTWYHVALVRASGVLTMYVNGVSQGTPIASDTANYTEEVFTVGTYFPSSGMDGWTDEFHILKGTAAWTSNFTPPSAPYAGVGPYEQLGCSRASIGYSQTAAGVLKKFETDNLRITDLGLLVEAARTNELTHSQDSGTWSLNNITVTNNAAVAPDGTTTAMLWTVTASTFCATGPSYGGFAATSGDHVVASIYAKAGIGNWFYISINDASPTNDCKVWFDLVNGVVGSNATAGAIVIDSSSIEALANGWYRCVVVAHATASYTISGLYMFAAVGADGSNNGVSGDTRYAWGAQFETFVTFVSSYIPTTTGSVTRAADLVTCIGTLETVLEGTVASAVVDIDLSVPPNNYWGFIGSTSGSDPAPLSSRSLNTNLIASYAEPGDVELAATIGNSLLIYDAVKVGAAWNQGTPGRSVVGGGGTVASDASALTLHPINPTLGKWGSPTLFGLYRRVTGWTTRLADATLQGFTNP